MTNKPKKWLIFLLLFVVITLIVSAIFRILTPPEQNIPQTDIITQNANGSQSTFSGVVFLGSFSPPEKLSVYSYEELPQEENLQKTLIERFSLEPHKTSPDLWIGEKYSLSFDENYQLYTLIKNNIGFLNTTNVLTLTEATTASQLFIETYFPTISIKPIKNQVQFLSNSLHKEETNSSQAQLIEIPYSYTIDGFPLMRKKQEIFPFVFLINSQKEVQKLSFTPIFIKLIDLQIEKRVFSIEEALDNINQKNLGSIVSSDNNLGGVPDISSIISGNMTSVFLEYRLDETAKIAYPFYRFSGTAINDQNVEINVEIITPAIPTTAAVDN